MKIRMTVLLSVIGVACAAQHKESHQQLKEMDFLLGNWAVVVEARLSVQGPWETSTGKSVVTKTLGGSLLEESFEGTREGKPFISKTFFAVNPLNNHFQRTFIDEPHGALIDFEGTRPTADSLIFDRRFVNPAGTEIRQRTVYVIHSPQSFSVTSMRFVPGMTSWDVNGRMRYDKK